MNRYVLSAALLLATTGLSAIARADDPIRLTNRSVVAEVTGMTDYRVRGISRSDDHPAAQGKLEFQHPVGVYGGAQATTVDLNIDDDAVVETVLYGGYKGQYAGIDYDARLNWSAYPGGDNDDMDYFELVTRGGYDFGPFYAGLTWAISPDYLNSSGMALYYGGDVTVPLAGGFSLGGHLGFQFLDEENLYLSSDTMDWGAALGYNYAPYDVDFSLEYVDTDLDKNECTEKCGGQVLLKASKDFGW